jgi:hypothetical protein
MALFADTRKFTVRRWFLNSTRKVTIYKGLTLQEAQEHCKSPEATSAKATSAAAKARTRKHGPCFDGYEQD